jgi:predicted nucleic acid-binding protein
MAPRRMVLDTDVASRIFRGQDLDSEKRQALATYTAVLTFVTVAEWAKWAHKRGWGSAACCTHNRLPLLTRNRKDFDPLTHHGLSLL